MLNSKSARFFALMVLAGSMTAATALASGGAGSGSSVPGSGPKPIPTPTQKPGDDIRGRCRFEAVFDSGKGGAFVSVCRARFAFDKRDDDDKNEREDDFLEVECNGREIYDDGVRVRVIRDRNDRDDDERDVDLLVKGRGEWSPRILIEEVNLKRPSRRDSRAVLKLRENGFVTELRGRCELEKKHEHDGPPVSLR